MRWATSVIAAAVMAAAFGVDRPTARAKSPREGCLESFENAQRARRDGKLRQAREDFRSCAVESCPGLVRKDCTDALAELAKQVPSVRVSARDASGESVDDFTLEIDGAAVEVDDKPIELDPGEHAFVFVFADGKRVERRVTLKSGELAVPVIGELEQRAKRAPLGDTPKDRPVAGTPTIVYVLGGVAIVGLGTFVGFGLAGNGTASCKGHCTNSEIDTLNRQYLIADIGLIVAAASGGAAAYFYFSRPTFVAALPLPRGAALATGVSF